MEALGLLIPLAAIIFAFVAFQRASSAREESERLVGELRGLRAQLDRLRQEITASPPSLPHEREQPIVARGAVAPVKPAEQTTAATPAIPPMLPAFTKLAAKSMATHQAVPTTVPPSRPPYVEPAPSPSSPLANINWEQFMGVRLFAWLGGLALFLAAAFFVRYSFEHDLISPVMRVAIGFVTGIGLLFGGVLMSQKQYKITADTLSATGTVILYAVTFACKSVYHFDFFGVLPTLLLMVLITTTAFLIAVRLNAMVVAVLGMLGGFLTPLLVNSGVDNPVGLFTYIALLDLGLLAVAFVRRWDWLNLAGAIGTVITQFVWAEKFFSAEKVFIAMAVFLGFCALYVGTAAWSRPRQRANLWLIVATLLMPAATFVFVLRLIANEAIGYRPGVLFAFIVGADLAALALATLHAKAINLAAPNSPPTAAAGEGDPDPAENSLPPLAWLNQAAGAVVFFLLALWTGGRVNDPLLFWALGGYFGFAVLHTAFPILLHRRHPDVPITAWAHMFPILSLLLTLIPMFKFESVSFLIWPFVLLVDLLAIGLAVVTASIAGILLALCVTVGVALLWLARIPAELTGLPDMLIVIAGMAAMFTVAGVFAGRKILARQKLLGMTAEPGLLPPAWLPADVQQQIPALSGVLPFLLLLIVTARLPLESPTPVFGLALVLVGLLLGLARLASMTWLPAVGLGCSFLLEHAWHFRHFATPNAGLALGWYLVFYAVFTLYPFLFHRGDGSKVIAWITSAVAGPLQFWLIYDLTKRAWPNDVMGLVPALFVLPALGCLAAALKQIPATHQQRNTILAWFGGVTLFFITLIFPIQFDRQWLTIAWGLEGAALLWLFHRIPHQGLRHVGVALLVVAFVRLTLNPAVLGYHPRSETGIFNWYLYTYGLVIAALFAGAKLLVPPNHRVLAKDARPLLVTLGTVLAFFLMNIEIADYFTVPGERALTFRFHGDFARDMSYTIGWALFAFVLLVTGISRQVRAARWAGIGLLAVTLLKLFFHDLATLNQLFRVGALVGVAVVAIVASFLYQKFLASSAAETDPNPAAGSAGKS